MIDPSRAKTFDTVAALYDQARPSYPDNVIEAILKYSGVASPGNLLEIGAGTGKATVLFARRGFRIHCLEPGHHLSAILERNTKALRGEVTIENSKFEDWRNRGGKFDLIYAAQSFHWVDPKLRLKKAHEILKAGGALALFWNKPFDDDSIHRSVFDKLYRDFAPEIAEEAKHRPFHTQLLEIQNELTSSGLFRNVTSQNFNWSESYTGEAYVNLLGTYSDHKSLADEKRNALFRAIKIAIDQMGGKFEMPYVTELHLATCLGL